MKFTSSNVKSPNYRENHELYVGTGIGAFKKIQVALEEDPYEQKNLVEISALTKESEITALAFGKPDKTEILIGRRNVIEIYDVELEKVKHSIPVEKSKVAGLAAYDKYIVVAYVDGQLRCMPLEEAAEEQQENSAIDAENAVDASYKFSAGDNIAHMRQCPSAAQLIATGGEGRQNNLKIFDLSAGGKQIFTSKNLPNDYLELEVPVWDSDVGFIDAGPHTLATCSRHGYVRVYDTRKQRRPVQCYESKEQMSFTTLVTQGNYIYTGTTMGAMKAFDIRRMKNFVHTYKGCTGAISDLCLDRTGQYLASSSLDRYVRVHHADSCVLLYQTYVKSQAMRVLLRESNMDPNVKKQIAQQQQQQQQARNRDSDAYSDEDYDDEDVVEAAEYDKIFNNMETVHEKTDNVESDYDEEEEEHDDDEEESHELEEDEEEDNDYGQIDLNDDEEEYQIVSTEIAVNNRNSNDDDDDDDDIQEIVEDVEDDRRSNASSVDEDYDDIEDDEDDEDSDAAANAGVKRKAHEDSEDDDDDDYYDDSEEEFTNTHKKQKH